MGLERLIMSNNFQQFMADVNTIADYLRQGGMPPVSPGHPAPTPVQGLPAVSPAEQIVFLLGQQSPLVRGRNRIVPMVKSVDASYQDEMEMELDQAYIVRQVVMSFPAGCHQLVSVRLVYSGKGGSNLNLVPSIDGAYIALDDATVTFTPEALVQTPGKLRVEWWNYDIGNAHQVPVIVTLEPQQGQG